MANVPYNGGIPDVKPDVQTPDNYQRVQTSPDAFGGLIAKGAEQLGAGASAAGQFFGQVQTDAATNDALTKGNAIVAHFEALQNEERLAAQEPTLDALNKVFAEGKAQLATPEQQLKYDNETRSYQQRLFMPKITSAAAQAAKSYTAKTNADTVDNNLNLAAANSNNPDIVNQAYEKGMEGVYKGLQGEGHTDPTIFNTSRQAYNIKFWSTVATTKAVTDPNGALDLVKAHEADLGTSYATVYQQVQGQADKQAGDVLADKVLAGAGPVTPPTTQMRAAPGADASDVASIRHNNPGAQWAGPIASRFGAIGYQKLNDGLNQGNTIATFPTPEAGIAAQFGLLSTPRYANKTVTDAIKLWSGGNSSEQYVSALAKAGVNVNGTIGEALKNPGTAIQLAKSMAQVEAGKDFPASDAQWLTGYNRAQQGASQAPTTFDRDAAMQKILDDPDASGPAKIQAMHKINELYTLTNTQNAAERQQLKTLVPGYMQEALDGNTDLAFPADRIRASFPPAQAEDIIARHDAAVHVGTVLSGLKYASPEDLQAAQQDFVTGNGWRSAMLRVHPKGAATGPGTTQAADQTENDVLTYGMQKQAAAQVNKIINMRNEALVGPNADPAAYIAQEPTVVAAQHAANADPSKIPDLVATTLGVQSHLGVPPSMQHVMTRGAALDTVSKITAPGADVKGQLDGLQKTFGSDYDKVFNDMVHLGGLPSTYQAVAVLPNAGDSQLLARALQQGPAKENPDGSSSTGKKSWEDLLTTTTGDAKAMGNIKTSVLTSPTMRSYINSLNAQGLTKGQIEDITSDVQTLAYAKVYWGGVPVATAGDAAVKAFTDQYNFDLPGGPRVPAPIAPLVQRDTQAVMQRLDPATLMIPDHYTSGQPGQAKPSDYINAIRANGVWVNSPDMKGVRLMYADPNAPGQGVLVRGVDNRPLELPFAHAGEIAGVGFHPPIDTTPLKWGVTP